MTDEKSKVEKCAWCKNGPSHWKPPYSWTEHTCEHQRFAGPPDQWNSTQLRILAARRKDYEAGLRAGLMGGYWTAEEIALKFDEYLRGGE